MRTDFLQILFQTEAPSSPLQCERPSAPLFESLLASSLDTIHNQKVKQNGQTKTWKLPLCCMVSSDPVTWSTLLLWVEYVHNTLPSPATGMSAFQCIFGYQPVVFPSLEQVSVPSVQAQARRCRKTWHCARSALLRPSNRYKC